MSTTRTPAHRLPGSATTRDLAALAAGRRGGRGRRVAPVPLARQVEQDLAQADFSLAQMLVPAPLLANATAERARRLGGVA